MDSIFQRYATRPDGDGLPHVLDTESDELSCFHWLRGIRDRSPMLELRKRSGNCLAVGYGWIDAIAFDPSKGITISASGRAIRILGRNLNAEVRPQVRLFEGLTRHRVPRVFEIERADALTATAEACVVEAIEW